MTPARGAVAVDIGNTAVKVAFGDPSRGLVRWSVSLADAGWADACVRRIVAEAGRPEPDTGSTVGGGSSLDIGPRGDAGPNGDAGPGKPAAGHGEPAAGHGGVSADWWVASVHRDAARQLRDAAAARGIDAGALRNVTRADVPMRADVDYPDRLGIDRLLGAWGAFIEFRSPLIVIDIGSAVTVDHVTVDEETEEGRFTGGAIMPGISLQSAGLASGTDALPDVGWERSGAEPIATAGADSGADALLPGTNRIFHPGIKLFAPGKNTEAAIRLGILAGIAGGIEKVVRIYEQGKRGTEHRRRLQVVVTGGDAERIRPGLNVAHHHRPDLVCRALLDLSKLRSPSPAAVQVEQTRPSD